MKIPARSVRTRKLAAVFTAAAVLLVAALPWLVWMLYPGSSLTAAVLDKTVPDNPPLQHAGVMWFFKNAKLSTADGSRFSYVQDYYGYVPGDTGAEGSVRKLTGLDDVDLLYLADTYGVYTPEVQRKAGERRVLYGGTDETDLAAIRDFLNRTAPATLIGEYNTFADPTHPAVAADLYRVFGVRSSGWTGQYAAELADIREVSPHIARLFKQSSGRPWDYTGRGFVFSSADGEVIVLTVGKEITEQGCRFITTEAGERMFGTRLEGHMNQIFDIVLPLADTEVLAEYHLDLTAEGAALLEAAGLGSRFPAVVTRSAAFHRICYFAGNYAYLPYVPKFHSAAGAAEIMRMAGRDSLEAEYDFYWTVYIPMMRALVREAEKRSERFEAFSADGEINVPPAAEVGETLMNARTNGTGLQVYSQGAWTDLFVHGVNLGTALPGRWFTEFPEDLPTYYRWLEQIGGMGADTVRVYTLLDPAFYAAFRLYNQLNPERVLLLLQEIWPEEHPPGNDYLREEYQSAFRQEIGHVVDAVHGNAEIPEREGRAWGSFTQDVSPWILGYLVGRELEPHEVETTNELNPARSFSGGYVRTLPGANATEVWLAGSIDFTLAYEQEHYGWQHPAAIVNWPTLDPLVHDSERDEFGRKEREFNDYVSVDLNNLEPGPMMTSGLFGAYHIYPNYPDFMNNEPAYDSWRDDEGRFRYGGYLQEFIAQHKRYPAVVAEFGLATGMGNAHFSPDGYHHGSMSETEQGEGTVRMFEAMKQEGYAGGVIFAWMDEWAKKTWTTEPYMIPYDRQILWHNAVDPEQNYGILAIEAVKPAVPGLTVPGTGLRIIRMELSSDVSYLHIDITLTEPPDFTHERYSEEIDAQAPSGMEFLITLRGPLESSLAVIPPYNSGSYRFSTYEGLESRGVFEQPRKLVNRQRMLADGTVIEARYENSGRLNFGSFTESGAHVHITGSTVSLRIPWGRINVSDPSSRTVLDDGGTYFTDPLRDTLKTTVTEGIAVSVAVTDRVSGTVLDALPQPGGEQNSPAVLAWEPWNYPVFQVRLKSSYTVLQEYLLHGEE